MTALPNGEQREPVLELVIVHSTKFPEQLSLRCADDLVDGGQVMARLNIAGFKAGDRVQLRRVGAEAPPPTEPLAERWSCPAIHPRLRLPCQSLRPCVLWHFAQAESGALITWGVKG
jgi:hypothetical protein